MFSGVECIQGHRIDGAYFYGLSDFLPHLPDAQFAALASPFRHQAHRSHPGGFVCSTRGCAGVFHPSSLGCFSSPSDGRRVCGPYGFRGQSVFGGGTLIGVSPRGSREQQLYVPRPYLFGRSRL